MGNLSKEDQKKYFDSHLRHRITLLLAFRNRKRMNYSYDKEGDFFGITLNKKSNYTLTPINSSYDDDIRIDKFIGNLLSIEEIPEHMRITLEGVYKRANKELAHFTSEDKYNDEFNTDEKLIEAAECIEYLLKKHLYGNKSIQLPFPELNENFYY